jgi:hypothetical protein
MIMDRKEIKSRLDQARSDLAITIDTMNTEITELEAQLESEQPPLRHGDYGIGDCDFVRIVINKDVYNQHGTKNPIGRNESKDIWLGNIFDDLKALAEPLEEFELEPLQVEKCMPYTKVKILESGRIYFRILSAEGEYDLAQFERLHRLSGRLIAEAKRRKS